jgi:hypothetical protein
MGFLIELSAMNPRATLKPAPTSPMEQQSYWGVAQAGVAPRGALKKATPRGALKKATPRGALKKATPRGALKKATPRGALDHSMYFGSPSKCKAV